MKPPPQCPSCGGFGGKWHECPPAFKDSRIEELEKQSAVRGARLKELFTLVEESGWQHEVSDNWELFKRSWFDDDGNPL